MFCESFTVLYFEEASFMVSEVSFILHCIMEHQFIFSATYDSQEERKDKILYPYSRQVTQSMTLTKQCPFR